MVTDTGQCGGLWRTTVEWVLFCLAMLALLGCAEQGEAARDARVHELMVEALEPAANIVWDYAGWVVTADGEEELWPTTDKGWAEVATGAEEIAEIAVLLVGEDYADGAPDEADWIEIANGLVIAAERARAAALARDKQELFDAGGHLYRVCVACHSRYMIDDPA